MIRELQEELPENTHNSSEEDAIYHDYFIYLMEANDFCFPTTIEEAFERFQIFTQQAIQN